MRSSHAPRLGRVAIDANALDGDAPARDSLAERFRRLVEEGTVDLVVPGGVREELLRPETPLAVRDLVPPPSPGRASSLSHEQKLDRIRVRAILRGDAPSGKHEADAAHLSEAAEAGCTVFVTHDRRILRRRDDLRGVLPSLRIMTLEKFLQAVEAGLADDPEEEPDW